MNTLAGLACLGAFVVLVVLFYLIEDEP